MDDIKISIITATKNSYKTIHNCLHSISEQSYTNIEYIVIDGASTDGTQDILNSNLEKIAVLLSEKDAGIYDALNKGIDCSSGEIIGFLHSDDYFADKDIIREIANIFKDLSVSAVYGDLQYVRNDNSGLVVRNWQSSEFYPKILSLGWMPPHPTLFVRKKWYCTIGRFDTQYKVSADYLSILRMFSDENFKSVYLPKIIVKMRMGGTSNKSLKNIALKVTEDFKILKQSNVGGFKTLIYKNISKLKQFF